MNKLRRYMHYDGDLCTGCHSCEVACKMEHDLPTGVSRARIIAEGPVVVDEKLKYIFKRIRCMQCIKPPCLEVCPTGAIIKRPDGIIFINLSKCTGCQDCAEACPYNAIDFHPYGYKAEICNLCVERLDEGLTPFCVQHCMSKALFFGTKEEFDQQKQEISAGGKQENE